MAGDAGARVIEALEPALRLGVFAGVLLGLIVLERAAPRRPRVQSWIARLRTNGALVILNTVAARGLAFLAAPLAATGAALWAQSNGVGSFNVIEAPAVVAGVAVFLVLDLAVWAQHVVFHRVPLFWRLHRVHHADRDFDATTGFRFHPAEIMVSMLWKAAVVIALGAPVAAVIVFEIALNACAMFNHANVALPRRLDAVLRPVIVTPDMHRVHHSVHRDEHDTNFGFCLSVWDRLFGLYRAQPRGGHEGMTVGLADAQDEAPSRLWWSMVLPFRR
ncbi:MAG: sterol desaturase family protein [Hyphomonadaceae bacterium]|nr:sterol desaturase family protein [Hyphomonadaceae bacterium]